MKKIAMMLAVLALATSSAFASTQEIRPLMEAQVKSVRLEPKNGGINPMYQAFEVYALVNVEICDLAEFVKSAKVTGTNYNYQVFFLTNGRACPAIARMPVYEEVLVDTIYTDMAPLVKVNGKRGVIR